MLSDDSEDSSTVLQAVEDVVEYLTIGLSLLRGELEEENPQLEALWMLIHDEKTSAMEILGARRLVDFSLFKPRGHYTKSEKLKCYFRAMMWLGSIDFHIPGGACKRDDPHQLLCAVIVVHCLHDSDNLDAVEDADYVISSLAADGDLGADSLSVSELAKLVVPTNVAKLIIETATSEEERSKLLRSPQQQIAQKGLGAQLIPGSLVGGIALGATALVARPASFALLGQRFVWSAFIFTRLVYDQVVQEETKQLRRIPSVVDVAFALFGNNEAAQVLARRMEATAGDDDAEFVRRRDGIPLASNLIALRQVIDEEFNDSDEPESSCGANDDESETVEPQPPAAISTTNAVLYTVKLWIFLNVSVWFRRSWLLKEAVNCLSFV